MTGRPWGRSFVEPGVWERVARLLKEEPGISDSEVHRRLGVGRRAAAAVRRDLGLDPYRPEPTVWTLERVAEQATPLLGGHLVWEGRLGRTGTPMLSRTESVNRVVFRLHHGREPLGRVYGTCRRKRCVAGAHLRDDLLCALDPGRLTVRGLDLQAIRAALSCDPPYPPLRLPEARLAFRLADLTVNGVELAARLSITPRTFERWKSKGVPSPW